MGANPVRALLFVAGGMIAAGIIAWFAGAFDAMSGKPSATVAALPEQSTAKSDRPAGSETATPTKSGESAAPAPQEEGPPAGGGSEAGPASEGGAEADAAPVIVPNFGLLRVEPDGSLVIAGEAAPAAKVEVIAGATTLGETKAEAGGDFAFVLDDPLKPGEYQLTLRSTTPENVVAMSTETALVSVPDEPGGQVLALVEEPGKPSELITVPEPQTSAASADQAAPKPADVQAVADASGKGGAAPSSAGGAAAENAPASGDVQGRSESAAAAQPAAPVARAAPGADGEISNRVRVEAVEIEGNRIFVAGSADPGSVVRVYANDALLGEARASPDGQFLVEAERRLAVGDYIIRADLLGPDGVEVVARAAVPFEREPGEAVAAVAPQAGQGAAVAMASPTPAADAVQGQPTASAAATNGSAPAGSGDQADAGGALPPINTQIAAVAPEVTAPKLEKTEGAVIIRRGDSLWRISRRVYGRGVRYSTIYLANQDQISDPDRIWPGQVFTVPSETDEGEAADMTTMGEQATTR